MFPNAYAASLAAICAHSFFTGTRLALVLTTLKLTGAPLSVGVVMMAYALLPAMFSPRIGRAVDQYGVRPVLQTGLVLLALAGLALWRLPPQPAVLFMAAAVVGLAFNAFAVSVQKLIGELPARASQAGLSPADRRKQNFGTLATASSISSFAGPLLAGWGMDHLPAQAVFGLLALLPVLAWGGSWFWQWAPRPQAAAAMPGRVAAPSLLTPQMLPKLLLIVMLTAAGDALAFLTPLIGAEHGLSGTQVGAILSMFALGSFVVRLGSGLFIAKLSDGKTLVATLVASAVILLGYSQISTYGLLSALSFGLGLWLGLGQPMTQSLLHRSVPPDRVGEALGLRLAAVGATQAAMPLLLGLGAQTAGVAPTLVGVALVIGGFALFFAVSSPLETHREPE